MKCIVCENNNDFVALSPDLCTANNWLCKKCGLVFIPRESEEKHNYYKEDGYYTDSANLAARRFMISKRLLLQLAKDRVSTIENLTSINFNGKSILDAGCGYGETLGYLKLHRQCTVFGVEPSPEAAKTGMQMFGIKIADNIFEHHDFNGETFDLIMCNHALEHVVDPRKFLGLLKSRLKPDGLLYLEVPNVMWPSGGFSLNNFLYDEHLQTFSSSNLSLLLNQCGFSVNAYSDQKFLQFSCVPILDQINANIPAIQASTIENFLRKYKVNYSLFQHIQVYFGKSAYLARLIYSKILDKFNFLKIV